VDLESLGIKRIKVPQTILDKLPLLVYIGDDAEAVPLPSSPGAAASTDQDAGAIKPESKPTPASSIEIAKDSAAADISASEEQKDLPPISSLPHAKLEFSQPSCSICLDDFESGQSIVRQLPCKHIFHPACIDPVLKEYSSLCPVCKSKVLPPGFCPDITNDMVRRVRGVRHMRRIEAFQRGHAEFLDPVAGTDGPRRVAVVNGRAGSFQRQLAMRSGMYGPRLSQSGDRRASTAPRLRQQGTELTTLASAASAPEGAARPANVSREEWARRRAQGMFEQPGTVDEAERQQQSQRPACKYPSDSSSSEETY
jgi:hypothetical protein